MMEELQIAIGAFQLPAPLSASHYTAPGIHSCARFTINLRAGPFEVEDGASCLLVDLNLELDWGTVIHIIYSLEWLPIRHLADPLQHVSYGEFGGPLNLLHYSKSDL